MRCARMVLTWQVLLAADVRGVRVGMRRHSGSRDGSHRKPMSVHDLHTQSTSFVENKGCLTAEDASVEPWLLDLNDISAKAEDVDTFAQALKEKWRHVRVAAREAGGEDHAPQERYAQRSSLLEGEQDARRGALDGSLGRSGCAHGFCTKDVFCAEKWKTRLFPYATANYSGAFGTVYLTQDFCSPGLKQVAVKVLSVPGPGERRCSAQNDQEK